MIESFGITEGDIEIVYSTVNGDDPQLCILDTSDDNGVCLFGPDILSFLKLVKSNNVKLMALEMECERRVCTDQQG